MTQNNIYVPTIDDIYIELIGPDEAAAYLATNTHNRRPKAKKINQYAADMLSGEWRWTGESVTFSTEGVLLDGQNRLMAVVKSGATVHFLVVRNVEARAQDVMDTGASRTFADALKLRGESDPAVLAAATRLIHLYEADHSAFRHGGQGGVGTSIPVLLAALEKHPGLREHLRLGGRLAHHTGLSKSAAVFAAYVLHNIDAEDAAFFFERMIDGVGIGAGHPIHELRRALERERRDTGARYYVPLLAVTFKAWNLYREGRLVQQLRWRSGGAAPEPFPTPK